MRGSLDFVPEAYLTKGLRQYPCPAGLILRCSVAAAISGSFAGTYGLFSLNLGRVHSYRSSVSLDFLSLSNSFICSAIVHHVCQAFAMGYLMLAMASSLANLNSVSMSHVNQERYNMKITSSLPNPTIPSC